MTMNASGLRLFLLLVNCICILQARDQGFFTGLTYEYHLDERHHKRHALVLSSYLRRQQVEHGCYVAGRENETGKESAVQFLVSRLK